MESGKLDKNGDIIKLGDTIIHSYMRGRLEYKVGYGEGTYDGGYYTYIGWFLTDEDGDSDGNGWILTEDSNDLEIKQ